MKKDLSIQEKLLVAALALEEEGRRRFSAEDLVVMAWRKYPEAFGLVGYTDEKGCPLYPNSNRVYAEIMGSKPLRKNGWLRKVASKMYQLSEAGRVKVLTLLNDLDSVNAVKWTLAREHVDFIRRLFESRAATKWRNGQRDDISFFDASGFWGINSGSSAKDLWGRFAEIEAILNEAEKSFYSRNTVLIRHGSGEFVAADVKALRGTHLFLQDRFRVEVEHIKARIDER